MPKISKAQGPSYSEGDPRHVPHGDHREVEDEGVNRAALNTEIGELEQANEAAIEEYLAGDDSEEITERPRPDYSGWTKAQLNEELDRRGVEHDPKANNAVLIEELERNDGSDTISGMND